MQVTDIDIVSNNEIVSSFAFRNPTNTNPYVVTSIQGLDADEIAPRYYGAGSVSGKKYYNLVLQQREIVINIALKPNFNVGESHSDLRDNLYKAISSNRTGLLNIRFRNRGASVAVISGFVIKFESSLFTANPEVTLTIKCPDGVFKTLSRVVVDPTTLSTSDVTVTDDVSTSPHGFKFKGIFTGAATSFIIKESSAVTSDWSFTITPGTIGINTGFLLNDTLHYSSEVGNKYLYITRASVIIPIADKIVPGSIFPIMFPGVNTFNLSTVVANQFAWNEFSYAPTFWGI